MLTIKYFLVTYFFVLNPVYGGFEDKVAELEKKSRPIRSCEDERLGGAQHVGFGMSIIVLFLAILLFLICLGILKGLIGLLFFPKIGVCGMNLLVDLPRPIKKYQEPELAGCPVVYDVVGWPIHPQTGKRTVRPLSKNTEFCMNVIFFITYPVIIVVTLCSHICYKSYDEEGTDNNVYDNVNTVVFSECPAYQVDNVKEKCKCPKNCGGHDIYRDDDSAEEHDTRYVMEQMDDSSNRLKQ
ncbi:uncharacterized protein [Onthophagus taurus]|uniref:uncharacterized protein n=1 Tax=Onthophagus taurus TaxID=166361 RepID=UPI000C2089FE|nr:uncharacterized protein LOC111418863 [Onthophagus taurus]